MEQEQGEINWLDRVVDRARTNLHRTDSAEYAKRGIIDALVFLSSTVGFAIESFNTLEFPFHWLVPGFLGLLAGFRNSSLIGITEKKEEQAELDNAVDAFREGLDGQFSLEAQSDFVEGYELLQDVADIHGVSGGNIIEAFIEKDVGYR